MSRLPRGLSAWFKPRQRMPPPKTIAVALQLMATMLESGVPLVDVFEAIQRQMEDERFAVLFADIERKVTRMGWKLSAAMREYPLAFPVYVVMFVAAGETGGNLFARLKRAGQLMERELNLKAQIRSALTGPFVTLAVAMLVIYAIVRFVMPRFLDMYAGMGAKLPTITQVVVAVVRIVNHWAFFVLIAMAVLITYHHRRDIVEWLFTRAVRTRPFSRWAGVVLAAQFCDILSSLLKEGVPLVKALHMLAETAPFLEHKRNLRRVHRQLVEEGDFAASLSSVPYFPRLIEAVANVGQEVGSLDSMLASMYRMLDQEVEGTIDALVTLVEPVMICVLGCLTAFFFVGLFLPIYGMLQNLGG